MQNTINKTMVAKKVDFDYITTDALELKKAGFNEVNQNIFTGINNKQQKVRIGDILDMLQAKQEHRYDDFMTMGDIVEAALSKELIFSEHAAGGVYQKLDLTTKHMNKCSKELKAMTLREFAQQYDNSKQGKPLVRLERQEGKAPKVRAVLSSDFVPLDNYPVMSSLFRDREQVVCVRSFIDNEKFMRFELLIPEQAFEMDEPNGKRSLYYPIIGAGNSEVGCSALSFKSGLLRGACANGLLVSVAEFVAYVRHIYQDAAALINKLQNTDINLLADKNQRIIDLYKNSQGIYVPKAEEELYTTLGAEEQEDGTIKFKYPQKVVDSALQLSRTEYYSDKTTYWHIINSITRALNYNYQTPGQVINLMDYEESFYKVFSKRMNALANQK
jgi:hypothetical protein